MNAFVCPEPKAKIAKSVSLIIFIKLRDAPANIMNTHFLITLQISTSVTATHAQSMGLASMGSVTTRANANLDLLGFIVT